MKRLGLSKVVLAGALLALGVGSAGAQNLSAYNKLASSLDQAVTARKASAQAALTQLDAAQEALNQLTPTLRNRQIVTGLNDALTGARAALARTPAELEAQVLLARGLMRKALYDQSLTLLSSTPQNGAEQLRVLTREFGLQGEAAQAVAADGKAGKLERVAWRLQRAAVQKISASLAATKAEQTTSSYVNLARATSWFTVVQDADGAQGLKLSQFSDALKQLASGDKAGLSLSLVNLRQGIAGFTKTLASPPTGRTPAVTPPTVAEQPAAQPTPEPVTVPLAQPKPEPSPTPTPVKPSVPAPVGVGTATGTAAVYAALGRALGAAGHADNVTAREQLEQASAALQSVPDTLSSVVGFDHLVGRVKAMQGRSALRPTDVQTLTAELANLEQAAAGKATSTLDRLSGGVSQGFGGWVRVLIFTLLAVLCAAPLYLLNLAFGGRNTYWRAIMAGLALLLLPVFLEGILGLLAAIGDLAGVGALRSLSNFTFTQGAYALPMWALLAAAAIGLTSFGFRGLCQQFGLLGTTPSPKNTTQHSLDWDEDV